MKRTLLLLFLTLFALIGCKKEVYYNLSVSVVPAEGGSVSPASGQFLEGGTVRLSASPASEYVFSGWSGDASGTSESLSVVMSKDMNIRANFTRKTYSLTVATEGEGNVSEKLISTKSDYESGAVVELTAIPAAGWSFSNWEGDLTGSKNPEQITVAEAKKVTAVFTKNVYSYNLKIVGPGAVDEYLVDATKSSFYYGQCVRLVATPSDGCIFSGWSGDISGSGNEITIAIDKDVDVVATFSFPPATKRDLPDLTTPSSYRRDMFYGVKFSQFTDQLTGYAALDYDRDGYMDVITCISNRTYERRNLNFYKGLPDGTFAIDEKNYDRLPAPCSNRKSIYGDFNGDGLVDICFLGTGPELIDPNAKEAPVIVYSHSDGAYSEEIFSETEGFYHAGCAGDFDNDGDLDIVLIEDYPKFGIMVNDGSGNFTFDRTLLSSESILRRFTAEFIDLNHETLMEMAKKRYLMSEQETVFSKCQHIAGGAFRL